MKRLLPMLAALLAACLSLVSSQAHAQILPYRDTTLSARERAADLLEHLTLAEKISLMQNDSPGIPRLGIRPYEWWNEALHGVARAGLATVFPQAIGMAASFDDDLVEQVFSAISDEARAKNLHFCRRCQRKRYQGITMWTPNINIFRDPRWGRGQETYGEDPWLTTRMGLAAVKGLQGPRGNRYDKLHACAKHFAVHSGPEWNRHSFDAAGISPRDLRETYLPAFEALVREGGVKEVMGAYNRFEGEPCCGSRRLLTDILRGEWGFEGIVVSDCGAIRDFYREGCHQTHPDAAHASAEAVRSGCDLECGSSYAALGEAVEKGLITEQEIDLAVWRLLTARFELGEMEEHYPFPLAYETVDSPEHRALALRMALESIVLLQNRNGVLPLREEATVAVVGPNADNEVMQWGNYNGTPAGTTTLLEGLRDRLGAERVIYEPLCGLTDETTYRTLLGQCVSASGPGFEARYWNSSDLSGEEAARDLIATPLHFSAEGDTVFAPGVQLEGFSARYATEFRPAESGRAAFRLKTNGTVRIRVDGEPVAERSNVKNPATVYEFDYRAGQRYTVELEFIQVRDNATLDFDIAEAVPMDMEGALRRLADADVILFAGGISPLLEGEEMSVTAPGFRKGDRTDIELPAVQRRAIGALCATGKPVVLVHFSGSAMGLVPEAERCAAILQAWYPGQAGGEALARVLLGDYNPAGRLPVTFYRHTGQLPDFEDYSMRGRTYRYFTGEALFVFGHGLSYTDFVYGKVAADRKRLRPGEGLTLEIPLANRGCRDGEEVVQVYLRCPGDTQGPRQTLRAFRRVALPAAGSRTLRIDLPEKAFRWFDPATGRMERIEGEYEVLVGGSSDPSKLQSLRVRLLR